jgi:glycosyltransferase involved in cell wall biosynthesis
MSPERGAGPHVVVDARLQPGLLGGVQQVVEGLAGGLAEASARATVTYLVRRDGTSWLRRHVGADGNIVAIDPAHDRSVAKRAHDWLRQRRGLGPQLADLGARATQHVGMRLPASDGQLERLRPDVVHFATQQAVLTSVPSIYQPHDLLHVHYPELLLASQVRYRDFAYRRFSEEASVVVVMTEWGRDDLVQAFGIPPSKVAVIPWAPVAGRTAPGGLPPRSLPERFLLYPAQTWPHKNHVRLLEAIAELRSRGLEIPLVLTGRKNVTNSAIERAVQKLGLTDLVHSLGYVLTAIYRRATALVFPSLFEGWGLPVVEAFALGLPVACSDAAALPEVAGGAAMLFHPLDPSDMAKKIEHLWCDRSLRDSLRERGLARAAEMSWGTAATTLVAIYRFVAGFELDESERARIGAQGLTR